MKEVYIVSAPVLVSASVPDGPDAGCWMLDAGSARSTEPEPVTDIVIDVLIG